MDRDCPVWDLQLLEIFALGLSNSFSTSYLLPNPTRIINVQGECLT